MAWTTPRTWTSSEVVTASIMNTHVRDNFNETAPAQVTAASQIVVSDGANSLTTRSPVEDEVNTSESTASTSYTDLTTSGPAVTATTGTSALVFYQAQMSNTSSTGINYVSMAISGATTNSANDNRAIIYEQPGASDKDIRMAVYEFATALTAGSNTFTLKYRVSAGTGNFNKRGIAVLPL